MFNKFILLLVLLIPSLCFGLSIKVQTNYNPTKRTLGFSVYDSTGIKGGFIYKVRNDGKIDFSQNKESFEEMYFYLKTRFPKDLQQHLKFNEITMNATNSWASIGNIFLFVGVMNDFQITEHKEKEYGAMNNVLTEIYLYKTDK